MNWINLIRSLTSHLLKPKATPDDLFDRLDRNDWKYGLQLISELEQQGFRAGHFRGTMYVHLANWEDQGAVESRYEAVKPESHKLPRKQYREKSGGRRVRADPIGGLETSLGFA